ncbi:MAG: ribose-5-phosphate isomerase RpiA, partial [Thermomicrobiales bacterium]
GLGSGSTAEAFVRALGARVAGGLSVSGVASSLRTASLARGLGIRIFDVDEVETLDLGIDGADEIAPDLALVKGRGGALLHEKLVARLCGRFVIVATREKLVASLGARMPLPVEVVRFGWTETRRRVESLGCTSQLRRIGADPFLTDSGNYILDCATGPMFNPASIASALKEISGVVEHGLFIDLATSALIVDEDGKVSELGPRPSGDG